MNKLVQILILAFYAQSVIGRALVTHGVPKGRLGDQLITYCHARWIAYKYKLPFIYVPFENSEYLKMSSLFKTNKRRYLNYFNFPHEGGKADLDSLIKPSSNFVYRVHYFPESEDERKRYNYWHFDVDWNDRQFLELIRHEIAPIVHVKKMKLPTDRITVAVHMRKGGGFKEDRLLQDEAVKDPTVNYADVAFPLKFPPFDYYVEQIKKVSSLLNDQPIYVHIFTDDKNPGELLRKCKELVNKENIMYGSRESDNRHDANVLDDFFALTHFDCLIRGESNFSFMASKLADFKIQIAPRSYRWEDTKLIITEVSIT